MEHSITCNKNVKYDHTSGGRDDVKLNNAIINSYQSQAQAQGAGCRLQVAGWRDNLLHFPCVVGRR